MTQEPTTTPEEPARPSPAVTLQSAAPDDTAPHDRVPLSELLEQYAMLRDTIAGLEHEKDALGQQLKAALQAGQQAESDLYRAELRRSTTTSYPLAAFREAFGDAATLEVSDINAKRVQELVRAGELDAGRVQALAEQRTRSVALVLVAKAGAA